MMYLMFFFFKQKTAYEMRISDWSSDVCSSDLDPNCGCCTGWVEHMRDAGFDVTAIKTADMASVKQKLGVPPKLGSCHTGVVNATGQIIEGQDRKSVV